MNGKSDHSGYNESHPLVIVPEQKCHSDHAPEIPVAAVGDDAHETVGKASAVPTENLAKKPGIQFENGREQESHGSP
jgi:hypothetical protein